MYGIGNPQEFTIRNLAELIREKINPKISFQQKPLPADDPIQRKPEIILAKKELGWEPKVSLLDGLDKTISWFKSLN